jgi:hypothetical protein
MRTRNANSRSPAGSPLFGFLTELAKCLKKNSFSLELLRPGFYTTFHTLYKSVTGVWEWLQSLGLLGDEK